MDQAMLLIVPDKKRIALGFGKLGWETGKLETCHVIRYTILESVSTRGKARVLGTYLKPFSSGNCISAAPFPDSWLTSPP